MLKFQSVFFKHFFQTFEVQLALRSVHSVAERLGVRCPRETNRRQIGEIGELRPSSPSRRARRAVEAGAPGLRGPFGRSPEAKLSLRIDMDRHLSTCFHRIDPFSSDMFS